MKENDRKGQTQGTMSKPQTELLMKEPNLAPSWRIKLLYDGECPLCLREVNFLQQKDNGRGLVVFVDLADVNYVPSEHGGIDYETAMGRIHAILADGTIIKNVEVFRSVYEVLGMGWIYAITKLPIIGAIADLIYGIWADLRLKVTGRPDLKTLVAQRQCVGSCQLESK
jgi:predicted DCC family thiol-disulfide oxidoreductase YuxK